MTLEKTAIQFIRFAVVGLASNLILYLLYLVLTHVGMGAKVAMSLLYLVGVAQSFVFNRRWSFEHQGSQRQAFLRYISAYAIGYFINLLGLVILVDKLRQPHQLVQAALILIVAMVLFLLHKFWVFADHPRHVNG